MALTAYTDPATFRNDIWPVADNEVGNRFLRRAATIAYNIINSALNDVYSVPFTAPYPSEIVDISDLLTKHIAAQLVPGNYAIDTADEFKIAMEWLDDIRAGKKTIVGQTALSTTDASFNMAGYKPTFDVDDPLNHCVDPDRLDDIADDRD